MKTLIRANDEQKNIIINKNKTVDIAWYTNEVANADAYIDLLFTRNDNIFKDVADKPVYINEVIDDEVLPENFSRINGWDSFLEKEKLEIVTSNFTTAKNAFEALGYGLIQVPNIAGMIAARNIAMIINEAYFAIEDEISTKENIDTAMKLGTNYPYGPFEWEAIIGKQNIIDLLQTLAATDTRYTPSKALLASPQPSPKKREQNL